jgi:hypothetical protein
MEAVAQLLETRLIGEKNIQGRQCGFGRFNADFWPVIKDSRTGQLAYTISSRYPETTWAQCNISMTAYLAPGPEGAASTVRYEMMREGIEECEARIFVEKALLDKARRARLGEEAAARIQGVLDDRTRAINCAGGELGTYWYSSSGWQERSARLFCLAGEIEGLLTSKGRSVRLAVEP